MQSWWLVCSLLHVCTAALCWTLVPLGTLLLPYLLLADQRSILHASTTTLQGSPRSGSGSERSTGSAPLYVERRRVPGMLQASGLAGFVWGWAERAAVHSQLGTHAAAEWLWR